jgi:hypothetical protein
MLPKIPIPKRDSSRMLLVEFNPYQVLVAELTRPRRGHLMVESVAEFDRDDLDGMNEWFGAAHRARLMVICSIVPVQGMVHRETVQPTLLTEPGYLDELVQEQQKGRFLTATPFKIMKEGTWSFRCVNAIDGTPLAPEGHPLAALICAMANSEIMEAQMRLAGYRFARERMEAGLMSLFGAVYDRLGHEDGLTAVVIVVILESVTAVYILGKGGVHTPNPVMQGMNTIIELGRKEFGAIEESEVMRELQKENAIAKSQAHRLLRPISRDLKAVIDSFEMTTGQPVDEMFCAYLPPKMNWMAEPLARSTGRQPFEFDCDSWLPTVHIQTAAGVPPFGLNWLGALSVIADLPENFALKAERKAKANDGQQRPWHVECSIPITADERDSVLRRKVADIAAVAIAVFAMALTAWQFYADQALHTDIVYWEKQFAGNQKLFQELNSANAALNKQSGTLDRAFELMAEPFQLSEFMINVGRTIPPRMRVDRIDSNDGSVTISGAMLEPAEEASNTLGRYMEELSGVPAIGRLFSDIAITTLQRKTTGEDVNFELTLRLNRLGP